MQLNKKQYGYVVLFTAAVMALFFWFQASKPGEKMRGVPAVHLKEYRLLDAMHELQNYSTKLYFAGSAQNGKLASWYSWKVERTALNIQERKTEPYAYNGWDTVELVKMLEPAIQSLNEVIKKEQWDDFEGEFDFLMDTCNACHSATEHAFVVVQAPRAAYPPLNQKFD